nr:CoA-binding protein [Methylibium sp.]
MSIRHLDRLLEPKSVVVVGASHRVGSVGATVWRNLRAGHFAGPIYALNPKHDTLDGQAVLARAADLPQAPDLAILCTPPATVPGLVHELGERRTRAAIVVSAGMDAAQKQATLDAARPYVSLGESADVDFGDLLDYLASDPRTRSILLYIESILCWCSLNGRRRAPFAAPNAGAANVQKHTTAKLKVKELHRPIRHWNQQLGADLALQVQNSRVKDCIWPMHRAQTEARCETRHLERQLPRGAAAAGHRLADGTR